MSKANYINRRLIVDFVRLQNWLQSRKLDSRNEWDERSHEMDSQEMAEHQGYARAIQSTIDELCRLMNDWPDLEAHRAYRNVAIGDDVK